MFSSEDKQRVEDAIGHAEKSSRAELVVCITEQASSYQIEIVMLMALAALLGVILGSIFPVRFLWFTLAEGLAVLFSLTALLLSHLSATARYILPQSSMHEQVEQLALKTFVEREIFQTELRTGVLILLSQKEHRATILGDSGIHAMIGQAGWDGHIKTIIQGIQKNQSADSVIEVIQSLEKTLGCAMPLQGDNPNELSNEVVVLGSD